MKKIFENQPAFLWNGKEKTIKPVKRLPKQTLETLLDIDRQKELLIANTEAFIKGKKVNNVLLWGERGTGKTSLVKGLLNYFKNSSLRMIQVLKSDIITIPYIYDMIYDSDDLRFILFIDDLSFNEGEQEFKDLKIVMDGGIEEIPENSVLYATSNRRNLLPATSQNENELFPEDSIQERASLIERFGLRIGFFKFSQQQYLRIVQFYAKQAKIKLPEAQLKQKALQWALAYGTSGRSAYQFILSLQISQGEFI